MQLGIKEINLLVQGNTAGMWQGPDLNSDVLNPKPKIFLKIEI